MKAKFGSVVVSGSGSLGGCIVSSSNSGSSLRVKSAKSQSKSILKSTQEGKFSQIAAAWRALSPSQCALWYQNAPSGLSGYDYFARVNVNRQAINLSILSDAPVAVGVNPRIITSATAVFSANTFSVVINSSLLTGYYFIISASRGVSPGCSSNRVAFKRIAGISLPPLTFFGIYNYYVSVFGALPPAGQKIFLKLVRVHGSTGSASEASFFSVIVQN